MWGVAKTNMWKNVEVTSELGNVQRLEDFGNACSKQLHSDKGSEENKSHRQSLNLLRGDLSGHDQIDIGRNNSKSHSQEVQDGNEAYLIANQKKGHLCYKVANNLAELGL